MTLRTATYDTATHKIVPLEPTETMNQAYYAGQRNYGFWNCRPVYFDVIASAPEYKESE
jgi:hypothetical protein